MAMLCLSVKEQNKTKLKQKEKQLSFRGRQRITQIFEIKLFAAYIEMDILSIFRWKFFELSDFRQFLYIANENLSISRKRVTSDESTRPFNPHSSARLSISSPFFLPGLI